MLQLLFTSLQCRQLVALRAKNLEELLDLNLLRERDATKLLDVLLTPQIHVAHFKIDGAAVDRDARLFSISAREWCRHDGDRRELAMSDELAALDEQRELARGQPHR